MRRAATASWRISSINSKAASPSNARIVSPRRRPSSRMSSASLASFETVSGTVFISGHHRELLVGVLEALHEDVEEALVEKPPAGERGGLEILGADLQDDRVGRGGDGGGAVRIALAREVRHLAEAVARGEHRERLLAARHAHVAAGEDE